MLISATTCKVIECFRIIDTAIFYSLITYEIPRDTIIQRRGKEHSVDAEDYYPSEVIGVPITTMVLNGACKLQWKADWRMRLIERNIAYEMHGDDFLNSVRTELYICKVNDHFPPILFWYGLFSEQHGKKSLRSQVIDFRSSRLMIFCWLRV